VLGKLNRNIWDGMAARGARWLGDAVERGAWSMERGAMEAWVNHDLKIFGGGCVCVYVGMYIHTGRVLPGDANPRDLVLAKSLPQTERVPFAGTYLTCPPTTCPSSSFGMRFTYRIRYVPRVGGVKQAKRQTPGAMHAGVTVRR
jgi:hypothetical protein